MRKACNPVVNGEMSFAEDICKATSLQEPCENRNLAVVVYKKNCLARRKAEGAVVRPDILPEAATGSVLPSQQ